MASIEKKGIRYFNIECEHEDKLEYILAKHGIAGYGIVIQLWRKIYQIEGYFCDWKEKNQFLFAKSIGVTVDHVNEVLKTCFEEDIFSLSAYTTFEILTSSGVQKRWLRIVKESKRKDTDINPKYDLTGLFTEKSPKTPEKTIETPEFEPQSKVNKSKENIEVVEEESARLEKFSEAVDEFFITDSQNSEKEKNSAQKENILPALNMAIEHMEGFAYWRNVLEHYNLTPEERLVLFKLFYEQKEDKYRIRFPDWPDIAENFYNWIRLHKQKNPIKISYNNGKSPPDRGVNSALNIFPNNKMRGS